MFEGFTEVHAFKRNGNVLQAVPLDRSSVDGRFIFGTTPKFYAYALFSAPSLPLLSEKENPAGRPHEPH